MSRYWKLKNAFAVFIVTVSIALHHEIKAISNLASSSPTAKITSLVISVVIALFFSDLIFKGLAHLKLFRWLALGDTYLEGVWIADTYQDDKLITSGLVQIHYKGADLNPIMTAYFPKGIRSSRETQSISDNIHIREEDLHYVNYFSSMSPPNTLVGVGAGHFFRDTGKILTGRFEGTIFYNDTGPPVRQLLTRLPAKTVRECQASHPDWMKQLIKEHGRHGAETII